MNARIVLAAALTAACASAQITSPKGFLTTEGSTNHNYILFAKATMHWQAIDNTHVGGGAKVLNEAAWRRDGTAATNALWIARTMTGWEMNMARADWGNLDHLDLSKNVITGTYTQVVKPTTINAVDITAQTTSPAPWTTVVKFDAPFVYDGTTSLMWEVKYTSNTVLQDYAFDFDYNGGSSAYSSGSGTTIGTSCTATGQTSAISWSPSFRNYGSRFGIYWSSISYMPATSPTFLWLDFSDPNLTIPGLCTAIHALPTISVPLGVSSATGSLPATDLKIPYVASAIGASLYGQTWAVDLGMSPLPFVFSYGKKWTVPTDPTPVTVIRNYVYKNSPTGSDITSGPWCGGIITRFQ
ncbi:MAG: hypothetical protein H6832_17045 [Planctomycetes bacterium]|nr:hypothetical protein [Planctomycetota bacterium]MCB9890667.1 hypothetical protein [Planctomycetota bacterium]MCB9920110.1 hypothetical protein [Planctomycetota bacterium]